MKSKLPLFITSLIVVALTLFLSQEFWERLFSHGQEPILEDKLTGEYLLTEKLGIFHKTKVNVPEERLAQAQVDSSVLGSKSGEKRIEIDLTNQKVYAYEGNKKIYEFLISSGKWSPTPTGEFRIWIKLRYALMKGGSKALNTYYYLPNVPYTMYFYNSNIPKSKGYGLHGTYWHNNFGHPMSHGCVNMRTEDAEKIFYWANPPIKANTYSVTASDYDQGTKIIIYGQAPAN